MCVDIHNGHTATAAGHCVYSVVDVACDHMYHHVYSHQLDSYMHVPVNV